MSKTVVVEKLQSALVDLIDLSLEGKQAHWNVVGPHFRSVHLQLDEIIEDLRLWSDDVAERLAAIGSSPDGRAATVVADSDVENFDGGQLGDDKIIRIFSEQLTATSERIQAFLGDIEDDYASQDLMIGIVAGLDKHAWMLRSAAK